MADRIWHQALGDGPLVAAAIHDGHAVRDDVARQLALSEMDRLREEDPFTAEWVVVAPTQIVGLRSRFEVDLNRPPETAVYRRPEHAWGLHVWKDEPPDELVAASLAEYDAFYQSVHEMLSDKVRRHGRFVVFDLHSYNHLRGGADGPAADPAENPQVNVGTGTMDRGRWAPVVDRFLEDLCRFDFPGGKLDVRENVKFRGGYFPQWIHETFPETGCAIAVEFKKSFMNEWTGEADQRLIEAIRAALAATVPGVIDSLAEMKST